MSVNGSSPTSAASKLWPSVKPGVQTGCICDNMAVGQDVAIGRENHPGALPCGSAVLCERRNVHNGRADSVERMDHLGGIGIEFLTKRIERHGKSSF